jgi:DNA-directed RNA polymerase subunit beta'
VGLANAALQSGKETELPSLIEQGRHHLHDTVSALFGLREPLSPQLQGRGAKGLIEQITGTGTPKSGFLHRKILKRQQDLTGRATATPDNTLGIDQIGVPEDMLWTTYGKFIMKGLIHQGYRPLDAKKMLEERHPAARDILENETKNRPIFVNRAPTLHKHNFVAAYPVAVPGKSLRVNPFMEQGQNLDYDGDTMQLHVPVTDKAVAEARNLTLSNLLFGDKHKDDLMVFPQHEAILGPYLVTARKDSGPTQHFATQAEAMEAYHRGTISMTTPVHIAELERGQLQNP